MFLLRWIYTIPLRLRSLFRRREVEQELSDELQYHIDQKIEEYLDRGMSLTEARRFALRSMNGLEQSKERCRDMRRVNFIENLLQDIRYGVRMLIKSPGFTAVTVATLALGIGANTAIFSIVNAVLLRPLAFREPDRLVKVTFNRPGVGVRDVGYSVPELEDLQNRAGIFDNVVVAWPINANLTDAGQPERLETLGTTTDYFSMFGVKPQVGRLFGAQDVAEGFAEAAVISDGLWTRMFARNRNVLGKAIKLDGDLYTIVGVLPPEFRHPGKTVSGDVEVWITAGYAANPFPKPDRSIRFLPGAIGRLKSGIDIRQAQARLDALSLELRHDFPNDYPDRTKWSIEIQPLQKSIVGDVRSMLLVLMWAVMLIILIASVNIANLLLARATGRQREIAVRLALGASRGRIVRQMLTESTVLSLLGGLAGVVAASCTLSLILRFVPSKIPRLNEVSIDWIVLGFALAISITVGILFGLVPAIQSVRSDIIAEIKEGAKGSGYGRKAGRTRNLLIISELALAVVLMIGAGLLLRTFWTLLRVDLGFNPNGVLSVAIWIPVPNNPDADAYAKPGVTTNFYDEVIRRIDALPGVESAGLTTMLPFTVPGFPAALTIEDRPDINPQDLVAHDINVSPDYLKLMQASLLKGRYVNHDDGQDKPRVVVIDETAARLYWPGQDPIGKRMKLRPAPNVPWATVVGVIKDIKHDGLDTASTPHIYGSIYQLQSRELRLAIRTSLPPSTLESQVRHQVQSVDPGLPIFGVRAMNELIDTSLASRRFAAQLVGAFAVLALLLASIGIYGLLAYMVGQRSNEIGIRMALGAQPGAIRFLILSKGAALAAIGLTVGLALAAIAVPAISSLLYGVRPIDPVVFVAVPSILAVVALLASYFPARRATRVDPIVALREG